MRFMVMVKPTKEPDAGFVPSAALIDAMHKFNEELMDAGVWLSADGLHPSSKGARVKFSREGKKTVVDGPFTETKELVGGFWLWKVKSREEAMKWAMKCPMPFDAQECEIEVRQVFEPEEFEALEKASKSK